MVYEYWIYDMNKKYITTVYMDRIEFEAYYSTHKTAKYFKKQEASSVWQKK